MLMGLKCIILDIEEARKLADALHIDNTRETHERLQELEVLTLVEDIRHAVAMYDIYASAQWLER